MNVPDSFVEQIAGLRFNLRRLPNRTNTMTCPVCKGMVHYYDHQSTPPIKHTDDCAYMEARRLVQPKRRVAESNLCKEIFLGESQKCVLGGNTPVGMVMKIELIKDAARATAVLKMVNGDTRRVAIIGSVVGENWVEWSAKHVKMLADVWKVPYHGIECEL